MKLSDSSLDWIAKTTQILNNYVSRPQNYSALEGLPCAGKTTTVRSLQSEETFFVADELRLPPEKESCMAYLMLEPLRTKRIQSSESENKKIIGDRSVISTLAHKATLLTYQPPVAYEAELEKLDELSKGKNVFLPSKIIILSIPVQLSRKRQQVRDREHLDGRLWYDQYFLELIGEATNSIIEKLHFKKNGALYILDSELNSLNELKKLVKNIVEDGK